MRSSYSKDDVILLLKDITGLVEPQSTEERERQIQAGRHYYVVMHDENRDDEIYKVHPEFLKKHTGGILINPDTQAFINLYPDGSVIEYTPALDVAIQKLLSTE